MISTADCRQRGHAGGGPRKESSHLPLSINREISSVPLKVFPVPLRIGTRSTCRCDVAHRVPDWLLADLWRQMTAARPFRNEFGKRRQPTFEVRGIQCRPSSNQSLLCQAYISELWSRPMTDVDMPRGIHGMPLAAIIRDRWSPIKIIMSDHVDDTRRSNFGRKQCSSPPYREEQIIETIDAIIGMQSPASTVCKCLVFIHRSDEVRQCLVSFPRRIIFQNSRISSQARELIRLRTSSENNAEFYFLRRNSPAAILSSPDISVIKSFCRPPSTNPICSHALRMRETV